MLRIHNRCKNPAEITPTFDHGCGIYIGSCPCTKPCILHQNEVPHMVRHTCSKAAQFCGCQLTLEPGPLNHIHEARLSPDSQFYFERLATPRLSPPPLRRNVHSIYCPPVDLSLALYPPPLFTHPHPSPNYLFPSHLVSLQDSQKEKLLSEKRRLSKTIEDMVERFA